METYKLYNGKLELKFLPEKHLYMVGEKIVYGVTNITGVVDKSGPLINWAIGKTIESIKSSLKPGKTYDELELMQLLDDAKAHPRSITKSAADAGTFVHGWIHDHITGKKPEMPVNPSLLNAVNSFLEWEKNNEVKFTETERKVYSVSHEYAGTMDAEGYVNGKLSVIDFKTSKGIYDEMRFQVAAYQQAREEETGNKYHSRWIIRLGKELGPDGELDFEAVELDDFEKDIRAFLGALAIYQRLMELKDKKLKK